MKKFRRFTAVALACIMAMTSLTACGKDPKETVGDALATLSNGSSAQGLVDELGITEIIKDIEEKPYTIGMKIAFEESSIENMSMLATGSISTEIACDIKDKKASLDFGVGFGGSDVLSGKFYVDEDQLAVAVPEILDKVLYVEFDNLIEDLKNSAIFEMMGMSDEDFAMFEDGFEQMKEAMESADIDDMIEFITGFKKDLEDFKDSIEVEEIDAEEFEINGKDRKCDGYEVVITKKSILKLIEAAVDYYFLSDDAKDFYDGIAEKVEEMGGVADFDDLYYAMEDMEKGMNEMLDSIDDTISDIEAQIYIYDEEIAMLEAEIEVSPTYDPGADNVKLGVELECTGGEYSLYDNYELTVKTMGITGIKLEKESETDGDEYFVEWKVSGMALEDTKIGCELTLDKKDGDYEAVLNFDDGYGKLDILAEGKLEVEKKESVKLTFDELTVSYADGWDDFAITFSGEYYIECDADITMPKGDKFNILTDKESDWKELMEELEDAMGAFGGIGI